MACAVPSFACLLIHPRMAFRSFNDPPPRTFHLAPNFRPLCCLCRRLAGWACRPLHHGPNLDRISLRRRQTKICDTLIAFRVIDRRKDPKKKCVLAACWKYKCTSRRAVLTGVPSSLGLLNDCLTLRLLRQFLNNVTVSNDWMTCHVEPLIGKSPPFIATLLNHFRHDLATGIPGRRCR